MTTVNGCPGDKERGSHYFIYVDSELGYRTCMDCGLPEHDKKANIMTTFEPFAALASRPFPLTSEDLREIADRVDEIMTKVSGDDLEDGDWRWGLSVAIYDDSGYIVGHVKPYSDGWLGFYPRGVAA